MISSNQLSMDQHMIFEKLLLNLSIEQQMRLKSEEQHYQMVDQLVKNQVNLVRNQSFIIIICFYL